MSVYILTYPYFTYFIFLVYERCLLFSHFKSRKRHDIFLVGRTSGHGKNPVKVRLRLFDLSFVSTKF